MEEAWNIQRPLLTFIFVSAKITVTRNWKSAVIPFHQLKHKLSLLMLNEQLTSTLQYKLKVFEKV